jgi:hypothetical protein
MAKVTVNEGATPSKELIAQAAQEVTVTDSAGRVIALKKPGILSQFRLIKILGDAAKNQVYVGMVMPLTYVVSVDGDPVLQPNTEREIDALIVRLDDHGVEAVMKGVNEHFGAENPEEAQEAIKK